MMFPGFLISFFIFSLLVMGVTGQGLLNRTSDLDCQQDRFVVSIDYDTIHHDLGNASFILYAGNGNKCNFTGQNNGYIYLTEDETHYIFNISYNDCDVRDTFTGDFLNFDVSLGRVEYYANPEDTPLVSRTQSLQLDVTCIFKTSDLTVTSSYRVSDAKIIDDISKDTTFELSAAIYKWLDFRAKYYSYPLYVNEGKRLYFQIKQKRATFDNIQLTAETCTLINSSDLSDPNAFGYFMLENQCVMDRAFKVHQSPADDEIRFSLPALRFDGGSDQTYYVICTIFVCDADNANSVCQKDNNCTEPSVDSTGGSRRKRHTEATIQQPVYDYNAREKVVMGRIILLDNSGSEEGGDSSLGDQLDDDGKTAISLGAGAGLLVGAGAALTRLLGG